MGKQNKPILGIGEIAQRYNNSHAMKTFKPENYLEIPRLFGSTAAVDMNRLVCQHQQHVASAYMRRIRKDKIQQRDMYYKKLQTIPMKIRRMAVGPDYVDPYTNLKNRLPKLGQDNKIEKTTTPPYPHMGTSSYVPHNGLSPNLNVLFKMNPLATETTKTNQTSTMNSTNNMHSNNFTTSTNQSKALNKKPTDELPFLFSPRRSKLLQKQKMDVLPKIKKRLAIDSDYSHTPANQIPADCSVDSSPRCPTNSPRNTFWNFNVPKELKSNDKKSHISSIPRGKDALAAINSVQKHNKPLPLVFTKA